MINPTSKEVSRVGPRSTSQGMMATEAGEQAGCRSKGPDTSAYRGWFLSKEVLEKIIE